MRRDPHARRSLALAIALLLALPLAGGCDGGDTSTPSVKNLAGWWFHRAATGDITVIGMEPAEEAPFELPLAENMVDAKGQPVSAIYQGADKGSIRSPGALSQLATWSTEGDSLLQTVLADRNADPGKQYATQIFSLEAGRSLEIASTLDPSGRRTYDWYPRCPVSDQNGWVQQQGFTCPVVVAIGASMAFDSRGQLHAITGVGGGQMNPQCPGVPTSTELTRGCIGRQFAVGPLGASSSLIGADDVWRVATVAVTGERLAVREKPARGDTWTETVIDPMPMNGGATRLVRLLEGGGQRVIVYVTTDGRVSLYRGPSWTKETPSFPGGSNQAQPVTDAAIGPDGKLAILTRFEVLREGAGGWSALALPRPFLDSGGGSVRIIDGAVHAAWTQANLSAGGFVWGGRGVYATWDGSAWKVTELGPLMFPQIVTGPGGPLELIGSTLKGGAALVHTTVGADGAMTSETLNLNSTEGGGNSLPSWVLQPVAVRGPGGALAATVDGRSISARLPGTLPPIEAKVHLRFVNEGAGRVRSSDGRLDCTKDCDVTVPLGTRLQITLTPEPGSDVYTVPCAQDTLADYGWCWLDASTVDGTVQVGFVRTTVRGRVRIGDAGNSGADRFGLFGDRLAVAAVFVPGRSAFPIAGASFDTGDVRASVGIAVVDRKTKVGWARSLPVAAVAVAPADDGGAWAVLDAKAAITLDGKMAGAPGKDTPIVARFDSKGAAIELTPLGALPLGAAFVQGAAIAHDGTAAVAVTSTQPLAAIGLAQNNAVLWREPSGALHTAGAAGGSWTQAVPVALDGDRAVVAGGEPAVTHVLGLKAGAITGSHDIALAMAVDAAVRADGAGARLLAVVSAFGDVDLGAGARRDGQRYLVEYDDKGTYRAAAVLDPNPWYGLRATSDGAMVVTEKVARSFGAGLAPGAMTAMPSPALGMKSGLGGPGDVGVGVILFGGAFVLHDFAPSP